MNKVLFGGLIVGGVTIAVGGFFGVKHMLNKRKCEDDLINLDLALEIGNFLLDLDTEDFRFTMQIEKHFKLSELEELKEDCNNSEKTYTVEGAKLIKQLKEALNKLIEDIQETSIEAEGEDEFHLTESMLDELDTQINEVHELIKKVRAII